MPLLVLLRDTFEEDGVGSGAEHELLLLWLLLPLEAFKLPLFADDVAAADTDGPHPSKLS